MSCSEELHSINKAFEDNTRGTNVYGMCHTGGLEGLNFTLRKENLLTELLTVVMQDSASGFSLFVHHVPLLFHSITATCNWFVLEQILSVCDAPKKLYLMSAKASQTSCAQR